MIHLNVKTSEKLRLKLRLSKQKIFFYYYFWKQKYFQLYLRPVNTPGSNNVKEHKADRKNGIEAYMCGFHMYHKFFMKFRQILYGQLSGVYCLTLCLKIFRPSKLFISFGKFQRHQTLNHRKNFGPKLKYHS